MSSFVSILSRTSANFGTLFVGALPPRAIELLRATPMWVWHSADDVIFPVSCSDRLVAALRAANADDAGEIPRPKEGGAGGFERLRYTRFDMDQEGFEGSVRGHSTGITASKSAGIYRWMLQAPPNERRR